MSFFRPKFIFMLGTSLIYSIVGLAAPQRTQYEASEHTAAGNQVTLSFSEDKPGERAYQLTLPNNLKLTYGELVTLGDFYEVVGESISQGRTAEEREQRFRHSFNSFAQSPSTIPEVTAILAVSHAEEAAISEGIKHGEALEHIYARIADDNNRQWNCITGGSCSSSTWWLFPGRYLNLLTQDHDHFGDDALATYQIGHTVALKEAIAAHATHDRARLEIAYALNGYACHFLSDRFASGHIRTPRRQLPDHVTPSIIGSLLVNMMHDEENEYGLHVHNQRGEHWMALGDRYYFAEGNKVNRLHLAEIMQASANQIYTAYQTGQIPPDDTTQLIPEPDNVNNMIGNDIAPLFYWDSKNQQLFRRENTADVYSAHWTTNWWSWSTLLELKAERRLTPREQYALLQAGYSDKALEYGLITDPTVMHLATTKQR